MAQKKKKTEAKNGAMDFAAFMAEQQKNGAIIDLGSNEELFYKTGDYTLDRALSGGIEAGSIVTLQGPASSGKSLAALTLAKQVVENNQRCLYCDIESKISKKAIHRMGLDKYPELFMHYTVPNLQDMIETIITYAESGFWGMIVIDSTDALVADALEEREIHEESKVGGYAAKVWSERLPQIVSAIQRSGAAGDNDVPCTLVLVKQIRSSMSTYGSGETTSGGLALVHYSSTTLRLGPEKAGDEYETFNASGTSESKRAYQGATVRILKTNQGAIPKDPISIRFYIGDDPNKSWGIDSINSLLDEAIRLGIIPPKSATSHMYIGCDELCNMMGVEPGELNFNGKNNLLKAITADKEFQSAIQTLVDERIASDDVSFDINEDIVDDDDIDFEELA